MVLKVLGRYIGDIGNHWEKIRVLWGLRYIGDVSNHWGNIRVLWGLRYIGDIGITIGVILGFYGG